MGETPIVTFLYTDFSSPLGDLWLAAGPHGLVSLSLATTGPAFAASLAARGDLHYQPEALPAIRLQLAEYFAGTRHTFDLPLDLSGVSPFTRLVLGAVAAVPHGRVASYGKIASAIGRPRAARAVGGAVGANPIGIIIPCHRIIRGDGTIGQYGMRTLGDQGVGYKRALLRLEGVTGL